MERRTGLTERLGERSHARVGFDDAIDFEQVPSVGTSAAGSTQEPPDRGPDGLDVGGRGDDRDVV